MIGIYKITNKMTGKSYIGQSVHCGKRLDEHCKGNSQFIDQMIEFDGIENYTFEILKTVEKEELNYWEDYYILQYNTMYPNGYNKRWNTSEEIRKTMNVTQISRTPSSTIQLNNNNTELTNEELQQLEEWKKITRKIKNGTIQFAYDYEIPNRIKGIEYRNPLYEKELRNLPNSTKEFIKRKEKVAFMNQQINYETKYNLTRKDLIRLSGTITQAKYKKCEALVEAIEQLRNMDEYYYLDEHASIRHEGLSGDMRIDEQYNCLCYIFNGGHSWQVIITWAEMFENGIIPIENVKVLDHSRKEMDIKDMKTKRKSVNRILFF